MAGATGGCLCGQVHLEFAGRLRPALVCHCRDCHRWHGAAPAMVGATWSRVTVTGRIRWYEHANGTRRGFCPACGSSLLWRATESAPDCAVPAGVLDGTRDPPVTAHIHVDDALGFESVGYSARPCYPQGAPPDLKGV